MKWVWQSTKAAAAIDLFYSVFPNQMRPSPEPQRVDVAAFAELCRHLGLGQTLTARVVFDEAGKEPRDILVQVTRFH